MNTYTVTEVISFSPETYGEYANHRCVFRVEGNENKLSAFVKNPITAGQVISGDIKQNIKGDKVYYNFHFSRTNAPQNSGTPVSNPDRFSVSASELKNLITLKVIPMLETILSRLPRKIGEDPNKDIDDAFNKAYPETNITIEDSSFEDLPL